MIEKLAELNRVLLTVAALGEKAASLERAVVAEACARTVIEGRMPDHAATIEYAAVLEMLALGDTSCRLTEQGKLFLELNPTGIYELTEDQKKVLLRSHYLSGSQRR